MSGEQMISSDQVMIAALHAVQAQNMIGRETPSCLIIGASAGIQLGMQIEGVDEIALTDVITSTYNYVNWIMFN